MNKIISDNNDSRFEEEDLIFQSNSDFPIVIKYSFHVSIVPFC
jgi:hypothetical protein